MQTSKPKSESSTEMPPNDNDFANDNKNNSNSNSMDADDELQKTRKIKTPISKKKGNSIKIIKKKLNDSSINTNETYERSVLDPNKYKDIVYPVSNSNINLKNYRIDNFKHLRDRLDKVRLNTIVKKSKDFERIFDHTNKVKNNNVINEINSLLVNIDNIKTKNSFSPEIKDSLLNSYKDFVAVNRQTKFCEGTSILDLKKDAFMNKLKIYDVKIYIFKLG
jgi:hypothetical protein